MTEFEEIPHTGGKVTFSDGQTKYEHCNPWCIIMYDILVSLNGMILCRGDLTYKMTFPWPSVQVMMASDREGFFGYSCPQCLKYFRASHGTSSVLICPYCMYVDNALRFLTENQKQYIKLYVDSSTRHFQTGEELTLDLDKLVSQLDNNIIKLNGYEERQQKILECKSCNVKYDIIGLYASCPSCGERNYLSQFTTEINYVRQKFNDGDFNTKEALNRSIEYYAGLGKDIKTILDQNIPVCRASKNEMSKIDFQRIIDTNKILIKSYRLRLFPSDSTSENFMALMFQKRHIIAHNNSIVDQEYLKKTNDKTVRLHQVISVSNEELIKFLTKLEAYTKDFIEHLNTLLLDYIIKASKKDYDLINSGN